MANIASQVFPDLPLEFSQGSSLNTSLFWEGERLERGWREAGSFPAWTKLGF